MIKIYLYDLIQNRGWTQRQLSQEVGVREATISQMCNNCIARLNVIHLSKICETLNCKVEDILEYIPDKK